MSKIKITLDVITDGKMISFKAPCKSDVTTHLTINNNDYIISDANNNNIGSTAGLWVEGAIVSVILNTNTKRAYIQNTVTPVSIGAAPASHKHTKSEITDFPTSMTPASHNQSAGTITAGTFAGQTKANATAVATIGTAQIRNISAGTSDLTAGSSSLTTGDIYFVYE
jgi:hypothetical protein